MRRDLVIAITGCHGFVGSALADCLRAAGHTVIALPRELGLLPGCDALVHLGGESPAGLWTNRRRRAITESRVLGTRRLVNRLQDAVTFNKQCAAIKSPFQAQAQKNLAVMQSQKK